MDKKLFKIPGTNIKVGEFIGSVFSEGLSLLSPIFSLGSGLLLSQITLIAEDLTKETIQNWVKRKFIEPPRRGRFYDENQVSRILIFNSLRSVLELEDIRLLLEFVREASKGTVNEKELLELFNNSVIKTSRVSPGNLAGFEKAAGKEIMLRLEQKGGDRDKVKSVIYIMLTAYQSGILKQQAEELMSELIQINKINEKRSR